MAFKYAIKFRTKKLEEKDEIADVSIPEPAATALKRMSNSYKYPPDPRFIIKKMDFGHFEALF